MKAEGRGERPRRRGTTNNSRKRGQAFVGGYLTDEARERFELIGHLLEKELGSEVDNTQLLQYVIKHCPVPRFGGSEDKS